jgi:predicted ribonuclease YlaK
LASAQSAAQKFASASDSLNDAARKQDRYLEQTSRELNKTVADAHDLLVHTDFALNGRNGRGGLLPSANAMVADQQLQLDAIEARTTKALVDLDAAEQRAQVILVSLDHAARSTAQAAHSASDAAAITAKVAGNPQIAESLQRLDLALAESDVTLANLQAISASGNRDATMIETRLRQALKPASLLKAALLRAIGLGGPAAEIASTLR